MQPDHEPANSGRSAWIGIGDFEFEPATGLLRRTDAEPDTAPQRIAPQPAALLALLIERDGDIATRDEIRARIWPDVSVEFDASLHHCVRQVRAALGERASETNYIETIPRRGYRLKCAVRRPAPDLARFDPQNSATTHASPTPFDSSIAAPDSHAAPATIANLAAFASPSDIVTTHASPAPFAPPALTTPPRSRRTLLLGGAALAAAGVTALAIGMREPGPLRIAILPFADPAMDEPTALAATRLGERVLAGLVPRLGTRCDVLGPRSTAPLLRADRPIRDVATELGAAHVVNARWLPDRDAPEILVELIRTSDGRHVWVRNYPATQWDRAVPEIVEGLATHLLAGA